MANHKAYMHATFPGVQDNSQTPHLKHLHSDKMSHDDPNLAENGG